jgi:hypothetical protein
VNGPSWVDSNILVFVDSTSKPNDWEEILSPMISLDTPEGAVSIVSEETMVDTDGDSGIAIGVVRGCWSISESGSGFAYGHILRVP